MTLTQDNRTLIYALCVKISINCVSSVVIFFIFKN